MPLPDNLIVNADDFGLSNSVNKAILSCFESEYINSTSLMATTQIKTNQAINEAIEMIHKNELIKNVGVHINLDDGMPLTNFKIKKYLTDNGYWDPEKVGTKIKFLDIETRNCFMAEIEAQISYVLNSNIKINHIDSHHHIHTLPCFYKLFLNAARKHKLKLRMSQTYNEGNYLKFLFRMYTNRKIKKAALNYSDLFETIEYFLSHDMSKNKHLTTELMLHPDFNTSGQLTDHYSETDMINWISYLDNLKLSKSN